MNSNDFKNKRELTYRTYIRIIMVCLLYPKIEKAYYYKVIREAETLVVSAFFNYYRFYYDMLNHKTEERRGICGQIGALRR